MSVAPAPSLRASILDPAGAPVLAFVLGILVVWLARWGPDWPAQEFRAWLAGHDGLSTWTNHWFGGEALPGYSVLYPLVAATLGVGITGLVAVTMAAWGATLLAPTTGRRARWYHAAVAVGLVQNLLIGQIPFLVGTAFGVWAFAMAVRHRPVLTLVLAAGCSLASPLAGAFLLLAGTAVVVKMGWRNAAPLAAALTGIGVSTVLGGAGGPFPFPWQSLVGVLAFFVAVFLMTPSEDRAIRCFTACYATAAVLAFVVPNPIGGNIARLGKLIALPLACHFLISRRVQRRVPAAALVVLALFWPTVPFATSIAHGARDPSQQATYYQGLLRFLRTQNKVSGRVEIPATREHWETMWVARAFPIARGWERQTDLQYNSVLYSPLTPLAYRQWLDDNSVAFVALPNVAIDYGGRAEASLLRDPPSYLVPVWSNQNWRVWRVRNARPLVSGPASIRDLGPASFAVHFTRPGRAIVQIHASRMWEVTAGRGCVAADPHGWLDLTSPAAGNVYVSARVSMQLVRGAETCPPQ